MATADCLNEFETDTNKTNHASSYLGKIDKPWQPNLQSLFSSTDNISLMWKKYVILTTEHKCETNEGINVRHGIVKNQRGKHQR